jgi:hypothetical protein
LHVLAGRLLAKACLLDAQLAQPLARADLLLREVAVQACCRLTELRLLRRLLAHGLADVGKLTCCRLAKLCTLSGELAKLRSALQSKLCLLHRGLRGLLAKRALSLRLLTVQAANS